MLLLNETSLTPASLILNGIPGLEDMHIWISLPFCSMYVVAMVGNCGLLYLISFEDSLHRSMYYFLAMLSFTDLVMCTASIPKALCIFWFHLKEISFDECLVQMFFIHTFTVMESGVLMLMALDRYVAICYPLHYSTILTNPVIIRSGFATLLRAVLLIVPLIFIIKQLPYCRGNIIHHTYCDQLSVANFFCFFFNRFGSNVIPHLATILWPISTYFLPPTMNPIVYGVKPKQIRDCVVRILPSCKDTKPHSI
uniref:Olfactory receptor n=1 Tax=Cavia porcellus TaxID=10141 RepID=A0A286XS87_CAVPO